MQFRSLERLAPLTIALLVALVTLCFLDMASAYKKPPFNGSIFGKRVNGVTDYEVSGRTLASLCEVANEACTAWFPEISK